ncbi:MAG: histidine kinase [Rhizobiales bacterium]|nr:histidine kinase [Hyphomicrobiales bacterium]
MPSLIRFLTVIGTLVAVVYGSFYVLAVYFEPAQQEVSKQVLGVSIKSD